MWTRVKFLGCYDTVAALGLPFKTGSVILDGIPGFCHKFHNFTLSESVENTFQALVIDDERKTFSPILWDVETKSYQKIRQVWFAGMHTDVGGGYEEQNLSDIPLVWMTQMAVKEGLIIFPRHKVKISEDADGIMHNSRGTFLTRLYRRKVREWPYNRIDKPVVHQSVLSRVKNELNKNEPPYRPWILNHDYDVEPWIFYKDQSWYK
jgi:hypothetical protein